MYTYTCSQSAIYKIPLINVLLSQQGSITMMYSGLDDITKKRMMQAQALAREAKGGWWRNTD